MIGRRGSTCMYMAVAMASLFVCHVRSFGGKIALLQRRRNPIIHHAFTSSSLSAISKRDEEYLSQALEYAKLGSGNTYPNPAVGCVFVREDQVIGKGFHPQAGLPHAEVFALMEAAGHVQDGVAAAKSVVSGEYDGTITELVEKYSSENGPAELFGGIFDDGGDDTMSVTAYVTLEPCSHHGRTPPCAVSLSLSKASRVVVGFRDPNPRVDGGGVKLLQEAGVEVEMAEGKINDKCAELVQDFVKRISPKEYDDDYSWINGAKRSALRSLAGTKKREDTLQQVNWTGKVKASDEDDVDALSIDHKWLERVDSLLWREEVVNLRLNKACGKKKLAKQLGGRIAQELGAHVAQTVGHTVLLYRPGVPPVLDLEEMVENSKEEQES